MISVGLVQFHPDNQELHIAAIYYGITSGTSNSDTLKSDIWFLIQVKCLWYMRVLFLCVVYNLSSKYMLSNKVSIKRFLNRNLPHVGMVQCMNACTG